MKIDRIVVEEYLTSRGLDATDQEIDAAAVKRIVQVILGNRLGSDIDAGIN